MLNNINVQHSWKESFTALLHKEVMYMLLLGFSAGLPILLIFSTLSLWLTEAGIEKSAVTYFSWAALGYSFKFVWAPLVDCLPIPFLTKALGLRRSWLLVSQFAIICAISLMACSNPAVENQLIYMALAAVLLGFSSATQDISIDAYRIEAVSADLQAIVSAGYMAGYRVGMIMAGAVALYIASYLGTTVADYQYQAWKLTYHIMSAFMLIGILATFLITEPIKREKDFSYLPSEYFRLLLTFALAVLAFIACFVITSDSSVVLKSSLVNVLHSANLAGFLIEILRLVLAIFFAVITAKFIMSTRFVNQQLIENSYLAPIKQFFHDYGKSTALLLLALIGLYRISDIVLGTMVNIFYLDMGFSKIEIANASKFFGMGATLVGGFIGGILAMRWGVMRMLFISAAMVVVTNLLFISLVYCSLFLILVLTNERWFLSLSHAGPCGRC